MRGLTKTTLGLLAVGCLCTAAVKAPGATAAASFKSCGDVPSKNFHQIKAKGLSCKKARKTAGRWNKDSDNVPGFNCTDKVVGFEVSKVRCVGGGGSKVVKFLVGFP